MRFVLVRTDRPGMAERRAKLQPAHIAYQQPFLSMIKFGGGLVEDGVDTSADVDIRNVVGNVLVFEAPNREVVEKCLFTIINISYIKVFILQFFISRGSDARTEKRRSSRR